MFSSLHIIYDIQRELILLNKEHHKITTIIKTAYKTKQILNRQYNLLQYNAIQHSINSYKHRKDILEDKIEYLEHELEYIKIAINR
jgi:hypothetical protein